MFAFINCFLAFSVLNERMTFVAATCVVDSEPVLVVGTALEFKLESLLFLKLLLVNFAMFVIKVALRANVGFETSFPTACFWKNIPLELELFGIEVLRTGE